MNSSFPRRRFLTGSAFTVAGVAASNAVWLEAGRPATNQASANDRVRFGMIGGGPLRRPAHAGKGDHQQSEPADDPPIQEAT
jgi:hypothetical protein